MDWVVLFHWIVAIIALNGECYHYIYNSKALGELMDYPLNSTLAHFAPFSKSPASDGNISYLPCLPKIVLGEYDAKEYCDREHFLANCSKNEMIWIQSALYGRMRTGKCISGAGYIGCSRDVTDHLHMKCSGKQNCEVDVNSIGNVVQPCKKDFVNYLDATFKCVNVAVGDPLQCKSQRYTELTATNGILSSLSYNSDFGVTTCPWLIRAEKGQQIQLNITVYENSRGTHSSCPYNVKIEDHSKVITKRICGFSRNVNHLYTSGANVISVYNSFGVSSEGMTPPTFVVNYQMIGCPDIVAPHFSSVVRTGHDVTVRCDETKETWFLTCKHNKWMGEIGNCTTDPEKVVSDKTTTPASHIPFPQGIIAAVILGLVLGIIIGFTSLGCYIIHRRRKQQQLANSMIESHMIGYDQKDQYHDVTFQHRNSSGVIPSSYYTGAVNPLAHQQAHHQQQHQHYGGTGDVVGVSVGHKSSLLYESPLVPESSVTETGSNHQGGVHRNISSVGGGVVGSGGISGNNINHRPHFELPSLPQQPHQHQQQQFSTRRDLL